MIRIAVIDTETTGLSRARQVIDVAIITRTYTASCAGTGIWVYEKACSRSWSHRIWTERPIESGATAVHGMTNTMLAQAPPASAVEQRIRDELRESPYLCGHNFTFDLRALCNTWPSLPWRAWPYIDTMRRAPVIGLPRQCSLAKAAQRLSLPAPAHGALPDALTTAELLDRILTRSRLPLSALTT